MRYVFFILMCLMILFAGVQYNDPDGLMWMGVYLIPAVWSAIAAFWQRAFEYASTTFMLSSSIAASVVGVYWFWPLTPRFWTKDVWYNVETAREGMGLMIVTGVLCLVFFLRNRKYGRQIMVVGEPG